AKARTMMRYGWSFLWVSCSQPSATQSAHRSTSSHTAQRIRTMSEMSSLHALHWIVMPDPAKVANAPPPTRLVGVVAAVSVHRVSVEIKTPTGAADGRDRHGSLRKQIQKKVFGRRTKRIPAG